MERLEKQMQFIIEVDKVKNIFRQTYLADGNRKENDAEHSWHLTLMAVLLREYANEPVDVAKVMTMVLIHDLVEIDDFGMPQELWTLTEAINRMLARVRHLIDENYSIKLEAKKYGTAAAAFSDQSPLSL